eukprot:scaffold1350_cov113-Isochrysis_galbana.AAC.1
MRGKCGAARGVIVGRAMLQKRCGAAGAWGRGRDAVASRGGGRVQQERRHRKNETTAPCPSERSAKQPGDGEHHGRVEGHHPAREERGAGAAAGEPVGDDDEPESLSLSGAKGRGVVARLAHRPPLSAAGVQGPDRRRVQHDRHVLRGVPRHERRVAQRARRLAADGGQADELRVQGRHVDADGSGGARRVCGLRGGAATGAEREGTGAGGGMRGSSGQPAAASERGSPPPPSNKQPAAVPRSGCTSSSATLRAPLPLPLGCLTRSICSRCSSERVTVLDRLLTVAPPTGCSRVHSTVTSMPT